MKKLLFLAAVLFTTAQVLAKAKSIEDPGLEKYTGYYHVGTKPGRASFNARIYIRSGNLFVIFDGDGDHQLILGPDGTFHFDFDFESKYMIDFTVKGETVTGFKVTRPRSQWATDLYASRNVAWNHYATDTEVRLVNTLKTAHFRLHYSADDAVVIKGISQTLEDNYEKIVSSFKLNTVPEVVIRIYPDMDTYHNAVLTPGAAPWQMGRSWSKEEIRMVSPVVAQKASGEDIHINEIVLHEFVHCIHLNLVKQGTHVPGWLWEGLAMYKGCCDWGDPKNLTYLRNKKYPTLKEIENDVTYQLKYELGYYLLEFIDRKYGWDKILTMIKSNGDVRSTLGISVAEFQKEFYRDMVNRYLRN